MKKLQTNLGVLEFIDERIIYIKIKDNLKVKVKDGVEFRDKLLKFTDKPFGILVDAIDIESTASINSIRFFTVDPAFNGVCVFQCIITNKISIRLLANFYVKFLKNKAKAKVFNNYDEALKWLQDKVDTLLEPS